MEKSRNTNNGIYIAAIVVLTVAVVIMGSILYAQNRRVEMGAYALETTYARSLQELSSYLTNISNTLEKSQFVGTSSQMNNLSANLWRDASSAKTALTTIPTGELDLTGINRYLSQVGNYAVSLSKKMERQAELTEEEYDALLQMKESAKKLNTQIYRISQQIMDGTLEMGQFYQGDSQNRSGGGNQTSPTEENELVSQVKEMEKGLENTPSLIYDGPFSDHILSRKPALTQGKPLVSQEQAQVAAAGAAGVSLDRLTFVQEENSNMPSYCFNGEDLAVTVTKHGGFIAYMLNSRPIQSSKITIPQAMEKAESYLKGLGIQSMKDSYYEVSNGICTINFAYQLEDVTCYTDLIKVGVAMDNGEVVSMDARGYIMNHKPRSPMMATISQEQALESVSDRLSIQEVNMALIPTTGANEILTYEFKTKSQDGDHVLVYVNADTGEEEQILILIISKEGMLTV